MTDYVNRPQDRQAELLERAMAQPGVGAVLDACDRIEEAYLGVTAATVTTPVVITTNSAR